MKRATLSFGLVLLFASGASISFAQRAELDELGATLAVTLRRLRPENTPLKIAVLPFREMKEWDNSAFTPGYRMQPSSKVTLHISDEADLQVTQLGVLLANEVTDALGRNDQNLKFVEPAEVDRIRHDELWTEKDMRNEKLAASMAVLAGANAIIRGRYEAFGDYLIVRLRMELVGVTEKIEPLGAQINFPQDWRQLYSLMLSAPSDELEPPIPSFPDAPLPEGVFKAGKDGVSYPECIHCPTPVFTEAARKAGYMAVLQLGVTVLTDGSAKDIFVMKPGRYGTSEQAVAAVQSWKFKPARDANGNPVPTRVMIEIKLRLF